MLSFIFHSIVFNKINLNASRALIKHLLRGRTKCQVSEIQGWMRADSKAKINKI